MSNESLEADRYSSGGGLSTTEGNTTLIDIKTSDTTAAFSPASRSFVANTHIGDVGLSITSKQLVPTASTAIGNRLELGKAERIIRAVEDWLGIALDFAYIDASITHPKIATITEHKSNTVEVNLHFSPESFAYIDFTSVLDKSQFAVDWTVCSAKLVFANLRIPYEELSLLDNHSTVLIPDSYLAPWKTTLLIPTLKATRNGEYDLTHQLKFTNSDYKPIDQYVTNCPDQTVEIATFLSLTTKNCLECDDRLMDELNRQLQVNSTSLICSDYEATGTLIPIGDGAGLHITSYKHSAASALS